MKIDVSKKNNNYKYDFSKKTTKERMEFLLEKIGFITDFPPHILMGYVSAKRSDKDKSNKIPRLIDTYTAYFLRANDAGSSKKVEYSFYVDRNDEMLRKKNTLFKNAVSFEGSQKSDGDETLNYKDTYTQDSVHEVEDFDSEVISYAISTNQMTVGDYKKLLSMSLDILATTKDKDLCDSIEQVIFNCHVSSNDDTDSEILKMFIQGIPMRDIAEAVNTTKTTVSRRVDKMLSWVMCQE